MSDLEIIRLCAKAMGHELKISESGELVLWNGLPCYHDHEGRLRNYDPLHDDAQSFALFKNYPVQLAELVAAHCLDRSVPFNLNRAIAELVAQMQKRPPAPSVLNKEKT